ncbi:MAG: helix-turn-helix domain-containing protein [Bacteroidota bacterium]
MQKHNFNTSRTVIHIKNMVSTSCVKIVKQELERTGFIEVLSVELGEAEIQFDSQIFNLNVVNEILKRNGFELLLDTNKKLVEKIKTAVIQFVFYGNNNTSLVRNSDYLSEKLQLSYQHLSKVFSETTGITLEKYIILIKAEKIKEMISYDEYTLSEIAYFMGYSSVQYLSNQFKQVTGYTVSEYKNSGKKDRKALNALID